MPPSSNPKIKSTTDHIITDNDEESDPGPADPNNPYDYRHWMTGGINAKKLKRSRSSSSEPAAIPPTKRPPMPRVADIQTATLEREAAYRTTKVSPSPTIRRTSLPSGNPVPGNTARNPPQPIESNVRAPPNPIPSRPLRIETARRILVSQERQGLKSEVEAERRLHAVKLEHMTELHAAEERILLDKHIGELKRLQERHLAENFHRRESAMLEEELEAAKHDQKMAHFSRQIAAELRIARGRDRARQAPDGGTAGE